MLLLKMSIKPLEDGLNTLNTVGVQRLLHLINGLECAFGVFCASAVVEKGAGAVKTINVGRMFSLLIMGYFP